jgi:hypothetical protein
LKYYQFSIIITVRFDFADAVRLSSVLIGMAAMYHGVIMRFVMLQDLSADSCRQGVSMKKQVNGSRGGVDA